MTFGASTASASTEPPGSSAPETTVSADQAAAEAALLTLEDFPAGWIELPEQELTRLAVESRRRITECAGGAGDSLLDLGGALAKSGTFAGPNDESVEESVAVVEPAVAEDLMARFGARGVDACFAAAMQETVEEMAANPSDPSEALPADTVLGKVTVKPLEVTSVGDDVVAYRITIPLTTRGRTFDLTLDAVAVRAGRSIAGLSFQSVLSPFPVEDIDRYVALAVERLPS